MLGHDDASGSVLSGTAAANHLGLTGSAAQQLKFAIPLQWGFDGYNPANPYSVGNDISTSNTQGFDLSSTTAGGTRAYKRAINAVSNPDEFDINLLVTPGVIHSIHSAVTNHAISKVEARADAFLKIRDTVYKQRYSLSGNLVKSRTASFPEEFYERDARLVLTKYANDAAKDVANTEFFGAKNEKINVCVVVINNFFI